jgi:hypothetical protein
VVIAAHLRESEPSPAFVELAIYASEDAAVIAATIDRFCREHLGAAVAKGLFHQSSIGSVTGAVLADGRSVVIKAHQPGRSRALLAEIVRIQSHLADRGVFATKPLAGPSPLGRGFAIVEPFAAIGATADAHEPPIRRALARAWHRIVTTCDPRVDTSSLEPGMLGSVIHGFCADWSREDHRQAPTLDEARAFLSDYKAARGSGLASDERRLCGAAFAYACAYAARCGHCSGRDERGVAGTFQHLVWNERAGLLDL